jgi:hypothetical protein
MVPLCYYHRVYGCKFPESISDLMHDLFSSVPAESDSPCLSAIEPQYSIPAWQFCAIDPLKSPARAVAAMRMFFIVSFLVPRGL